MKKIQIGTNLQGYGDVQLGVLEAKIVNTAYEPKLWEQINDYIKSINLTVEQIKEIDAIAHTRTMYRRLGKEPSRYRPSAEALLRRIVQNKELYHINTAVDCINFASIRYGFSIGAYDAQKVGDQVVFKQAEDYYNYEAIGRGQLNIKDLPVLFDENGPFGSPTSDSVRTAIDLDTTEILVVVFDFFNSQNFGNTLDLVTHLLHVYTNATNVQLKVLD